MGEKEEKNILDKKFVYGLIAIAAIVAIYFLAFDGKTSETNLSPDYERELDAVRARVNGVEILEEEVRRAEDIIEEQTGKEVDDASALERVITERLVFEEAEKQGIVVTKEDAEKQLSIFAQKQGLTVKQVENNLEQQGKDYEQVLEGYRKQLAIERMMRRVSSEIQVTEDETKEYYEKNKEVMFKDTGAVLPYEMVSGQLKEALETRERAEKLSAFVEELYTNAEIEYMDE
jgi:hypothetical protein